MKKENGKTALLLDNVGVEMTSAEMIMDQIGLMVEIILIVIVVLVVKEIVKEIKKK